MAALYGYLYVLLQAEDASATLPEQLAVKRVNAGLYALPAPGNFDYLRQIGTDNAQGELYLTDAVTRARSGTSSYRRRHISAYSSGMV